MSELIREQNHWAYMREIRAIDRAGALIDFKTEAGQLAHVALLRQEVESARAYGIRNIRTSQAEEELLQEMSK
jgi:hypothetical protein